MEYLSKELCIDLKKNYNEIKTDHSCYFYLKYQKLVYNRQIKDAHHQSLIIEEDSNIPKHRMRKLKRNLNDAWIWGISNFDPYNFEESFIREINGKILPEIHKNSVPQYRTSQAYVGGKKMTRVMPTPEKLSILKYPNL